MNNNSWFALYPIPLLLLSGACLSYLAGMWWAEGAQWGAAFGVGIWVANMPPDTTRKFEVVK